MSSRPPPPSPLPFSLADGLLFVGADSARRDSKLIGVPLEVQEAMVLKDLLSVLLVRPSTLFPPLLPFAKQLLTVVETLGQGIEGDLVTFDSSYDPNNDVDRMTGPQWVVDEGLGEWGRNAFRLPADDRSLTLVQSASRRSELIVGTEEGAAASDVLHGRRGVHRFEVSPGRAGRDRARRG